MQIELVKLDKNFQQSKVITNPEPVIEKSEEFTSNGIFSEQIFGNSSNMTHSCECEHLQGRFYENVECPVCHTIVKSREPAITRTGWISFAPYYIINPIFFQYFSKVIGIKSFLKILRYIVKLDSNGNPVFLEQTSKFDNLGLLGFKEKWKEILEFYINKKKTDERIAEYGDLILKNEDKIFISAYPVFSSSLRPAIVIDQQLMFDSINNVFNSIVTNAEIVKGYSDLEKSDYIVNGVTNSI